MTNIIKQDENINQEINDLTKEIRKYSNELFSSNVFNTNTLTPREKDYFKENFYKKVFIQDKKDKNTYDLIRLKEFLLKNIEIYNEFYKPESCGKLFKEDYGEINSNIISYEHYEFKRIQELKNVTSTFLTLTDNMLKNIRIIEYKFNDLSNNLNDYVIKNFSSDGVDTLNKIKKGIYKSIKIKEEGIDESIKERREVVNSKQEEG